MSKDVTRVELSINSLRAVVPGDIGISVQDKWQKTRPAELKIVLCLFGFFQQLAHTHDFALTTAERMVSSRPTATVQSATTIHQTPSRCRFPVNVIASPVATEVSLDTVRLACSRHGSCQVSRSLSPLHSHLAVACKSGLRFVM